MDCFFFSAPTGFNSFLNILRISLNICQSSINILWLKVENVLLCFSSNIYLLLLLMPKPEKERIPAGIGFITVTLICRLSLKLGGVCWIDLFIYFFYFHDFKKVLCKTLLFNYRKVMLFFGECFNSLFLFTWSCRNLVLRYV